MKKIIIFSVFTSGLVLALSSCSIKKMAFNAAANAMAPNPEQRANQKISPDEPNPMKAFMGEDDVEIIASVFPTVLKVYEMMQIQNPSHRGLALTTGELYIMYANAFVETPAVFLPDEQYDKKNKDLMRAKKFYLRGYNLVLDSFEASIPGFKETVKSGNEKDILEILQKCKAHDTEALYWAGAGCLAAFALEPMDTGNIQKVFGGKAMLERACELNPEYEKGAVWEVLTKFYAAAPEALGGGKEKAENAYKKAFALSEGKSPSIHVTYALSFAVPAQDGKGFDKALKEALAIDPESQPDKKLMIILSQNYANWLKEHKEDFILGF